MKLVALCGFKGSGKDWIATNINKYYNYQIYRFSQPIKNTLISMFNINQEYLEGKNFESREIKEDKKGILYDIFEKEISIRDAMIFIGEGLKDYFGQDVWVRVIDYNLKKEKPSKVVIPDLRLKEEYNWVRKNNGKVIRVTKNIPYWYEDARLASLGNIESLERMNKLGISRTEYEWLSFDFDHEITFDSTLEELENKIKNSEFLKNLS